MTDPLTRILNRQAFFQKFHDELERTKRYKHPLAVAMIDVDHFKSFNDMEGHVYGDEALRKLAQHFTGNLRKTDVLGRYGGEEFVVLMPETRMQNAKEICDRLRTALEDSPFQGKAGTAYLTVSIGIAGFPGDGDSSELLDPGSRPGFVSSETRQGETASSSIRGKMHRFLLPNNDGARLVEGAEAMLSAEESHHLAKVVRIRDGDLMELVNGQGVVAKARVVDASPKRSRVEILSVKALPGQSRVHVCFSVPKAAAFDFIIHRCTELGVASFQPIMTNYSLRLHSWNETRWQKVDFGSLQAMRRTLLSEVAPSQ